MKLLSIVAIVVGTSMSGDCLAANQDDLIFDPVIDEQMADYILAREAELADVETRGVQIQRSRTRILSPTSGKTVNSVQDFRKQTQASGLQAAVAHVEAVRLGARRDPKVIAEAILKSVDSNPQQDVMRTLYMVFRESIQQTNEDKSYWIEKLNRHNEISNALGEYLKELNDALGTGTGCNNDGAGPRQEELSALDADHRELANRMLKERAWVHSEVGIKQTIRQLQKMESEVRNRRQEASTAFQNFDQKANQLYNLLSSVMKAMNEMRMGTVRNLL
jgi:hypothetical protein